MPRLHAQLCARFTSRKPLRARRLFLPLLPLRCPFRYVYQAPNDCHGYYWVYAAHRLVVCLGVMAAFTSGEQLWLERVAG